ncbi:MAG: adenylate/guanylate cyclase domain-containing protein [Acidimicrobiales bacterium]|nr:adenylate/guanylate cyclase domain-containing protein [Acidimicrobiales bacterium]
MPEDPADPSSHGPLDAGVRTRLAALSARLGGAATVDELADALAAGSLGNVVSERAVLAGRGHVTLASLAEQAGIELALARRLRRAVGLPDPGDEPRCHPSELVVLQAGAAGLALLGEDGVVRLSRVLGSAMASVAEAAHSTFATETAAPLDAAGTDDIDFAVAVAGAVDALEAIPPLLDVLLRLHFVAAIPRIHGTAGDVPRHSTVLAVGFVDLVGSTELAERLAAPELAGVLGDFERAADDAVAAHGGRIVKYLGDAVMFVATEPAAAAGIALDVVASAGADPRLLGARAGVAHGEIQHRSGDYVGPLVNVAARLAGDAAPGEVLATAEVGAAVPAAQPLGPRRLRGVAAPVATWRITPARRAG